MYSQMQQTRSNFKGHGKTKVALIYSMSKVTK